LLQYKTNPKLHYHKTKQKLNIVSKHSIVIDIEVLVKERPKLSLYKIWGRKEGGEDHQ